MPHLAHIVIPPKNASACIWDETSVRIDAVCSSVAEAEYASIFLNARKATVLCQTLSDIGYPQPPTPLSVDNKCAEGLANDTVKRRRSKAINMRFISYFFFLLLLLLLFVIVKKCCSLH
jgi:hypothetical protein